MRALSRLLLVLLLHSGFASAADNSAELQKLYAALNMLNQQQQTIYQQFQMVQQLRQGAVPPSLYVTPTLPEYLGAPPNYSDVVAAQRQALERDERLSRQANDLLDRYNEIEAMKKPVQEKIYSLTLGN
ncbi:MAG: hypothetical protein ACM3KD_05050 [Hyphomicrobiaceae bacterium]